MLEVPRVLADLDEYRTRADRFLASLEEELYGHYAGLKPALELEPIYDRFADLTSLDVCRGLEGGPRELWRFACEGYLGSATRQQQQRIASLEATLDADVGDETIGFRMFPPRIANEHDRDGRERLEQARVELADEVNPIRVELAERMYESVHELGAPSYRALYERFGFQLGPLASQCTDFLGATEELWADTFDRLLRKHVGVSLPEARRSDLPRVLRAPRWDAVFTRDRMLPALQRTLADLGIELEAQRNVHLDLESRPTKSSRAFCCPIEVPARVMLVIQPMGGLDDWRALFHEAGHAEHFAHVSPSLRLEARRLGDNAVTEGFAFLLEHLVTDAAWLRRRLDVGAIDEIVRESATVLLYFVRRHCSKLLYELELHDGLDLALAPSRYVERMREATTLEFAPVDFLADVDPGFYCTSYLRAWALEAHLVRYLREEYGRDWFADRRAGSLLRELWSEGQGMTADEIAREVTGSELDLDAVTLAIRTSLTNA